MPPSQFPEPPPQPSIKTMTAAAQPEEGKGEPRYLTFVWIPEKDSRTPHLTLKNGLLTGLFPEKKTQKHLNVDRGHFQMLLF